MLRPLSLVKVRTPGQGDHCITLPESAHLGTSLAALTSKSKISVQKRRNTTISVLKMEVFRVIHVSLHAASYFV